MPRSLHGASCNARTLVAAAREAAGPECRIWRVRPSRQGETLEQLKGMAAFVMMTDRARGLAFMARIDRLIAASTAKGTP